MILNKKSNNNLKKGKNEIFDEFILDLFSNQYSMNYDSHNESDLTKADSKLPLD